MSTPQTSWSYATYTGRLASTPGAVIQLRPGLLAGNSYGHDLGGCQHLSGRSQVNLNQPGTPEPWEPARNLLVTNVAGVALSGFGPGSSPGPVQEDSLRSRRLPWSAMRGRHRRRS